MSHISVIVPIFREELLLHELRDRLRSALSSITEDFEVILVEDGSNDGSWNVIHEFSEDDSRIKAIRFSRNFGQHYAITAGLNACDGDWVVVMDGDLQDRPEVIPELYAKVQIGYDVVFVERQKGGPFSANTLCQLFAELYRKAGSDGATSHSGRCGINTKLAHSGITAKVIMELADHKHLGTTQRFAHRVAQADLVPVPQRPHPVSGQ